MARRTLSDAVGLLIAGMIGCLIVAGVLERRKYDLSGVPAGHYAWREGDRTFYVPRGGPSLDQRPQVPLTPEQYRLWEEYDRPSSQWGSAGVLCFFAAAGIATWLKLGRPTRHAATEPAAAPDRGGR
jgi:hypothetical protein